VAVIVFVMWRRKPELFLLKVQFFVRFGWWSGSQPWLWWCFTFGCLLLERGLVIIRVSIFQIVKLVMCHAYSYSSYRYEFVSSLQRDVYFCNKMHYFSAVLGKELYMFQTDWLSVIRSLNTVFTVTVICHASYVDCLLARSAPDLSNRQSL